ncbi:MAG TPA: O-antigen ligase family protein [Solirubrobacteraceae bacterium]|jgi:tetratricopeptide (TPR) repeat protein|nr:O-antigen ligase family protein [Solirubrobacteraceae bacterium]
MRLIAPLRAAPAAVPALGALALVVAWATDQAGYPLTHWAPGGLIVLALLAIALLAVPLRWASIPTPVRIALGCLAGYTALSFLSILWAGVPGDAWEGADRTLLYLLVFALFACWAQTPATAGLLLCAWTLALAGVALFALAHLDAAAHSATRLTSLLPGGRLVYPAGYANADAAQWLIAAWPALLLARTPRLPWALRGVLAGATVVLAAMALFSQSRGSLYATPVMLVLVFALFPGRVRTFALLVPIAAGIAVAAPAVLRVGERVSALELAAARAATASHASMASARSAAALHEVAAALHQAVAAVLLAAAIVGVLVAAGAALESRRAVAPTTAARVHKSLATVAVAALVVMLAGVWAAAGDPLVRARHAWDTFKSPSGYAADATTGSRLTSGLGSNRYDFYRVALDQFAAHPLLGIGADNFAEQYLAHGRSSETPRYPHSVELRTLAQTGLVGALLALVGLAAALVAGWRALARHPDPLARAVAAAAVAGFAYWVVHGSFDWFWEFAGLGAAAFALLGLACALAPRGAAGSVHGGKAGGEGSFAGSNRRSAERAERPRARGWRARCDLALGAFAAVAVAASFTAPWLSALEVQSAARIWVGSPAQAYARLDHAARLDPLSDEPYVVAGTIALRRGELARADREFALALGRTPSDAYATLERGAIASARGRRREALGLLERAAHLNPRDPLTCAALALTRRGGRVNIRELNRSILLNARQFT